MTLLLKECETQAMTLSVKDRAVLAQHLIESLDGFDSAGNERLWVEEAEVRYNAYKRGEIQSVDAEVAIREIRDSLQ